MIVRRPFVQNFPFWILAIFSIFSLFGCAHLQETAKAVWGSSIAHLEKARPDGRSLVVSEDRAQAFQDVVRLLEDQKVNVYLKDKEKNYLAAMGFAGHVDTTQVGVFFTPEAEGKNTKIEISSLSPTLVRDVDGLLSSYFKKGAGNEKA